VGIQEEQADQVMTTAVNLSAALPDQGFSDLICVDTWQLIRTELIQAKNIEKLSSRLHGYRIRNGAHQ